jgi:hypothetical protein
MKTLLIILSALFIFGCSGDNSSDSTTVVSSDIQWWGDYSYQPFLCDQEHKNNGYRNTEQGKSYLCDGENFHIIAEDGQDGTTTTNVVTVSNPSGFAEAGPFQGYSEVTMWPLDENVKQTGDPVIGNTKADDSGSFTVYADLSGAYIKTIVRGEAFNETSGGFDENVVTESTIPGDSQSFNANHFSSIVSIVANYWYHEDTESPYYHSPLAFDAAEETVLDYFDYSGLWGPSTKKSYEMTLTGNTTDDAKLVLINSTIALNHDGPAQGLFMQKISEDIYTGTYVLQSQVNAITENLLFAKIRDNLNNYYADRWLDYTTAPIELLPGIPSYYDDIWNGTHEVVESVNLDQTSTCTIDVNEFNSFAYPKVFANIEAARYYASELTGNMSLWSASTCDNGITTFSCPGTKLLDIEELKEAILPEPANLNYNGTLGEHNLISGQYFEVQNTESNSAPSHVCTGATVPFGSNLAAHDNDWTHAIGYSNSTAWFRKQPKSVTMD